MAETFYDVLGVDPDADEPEITDAYRDRIKETHPDVSDADDAEQQAKKVIEAKEVLTDADERARYDRLGHTSYIEQTSTDASWTTGDPTVSSATREDRSATGTGTGTTGTGSGAARTGRSANTTGDSSSTWAGRGDWRDAEAESRRRRRRQKERHYRDRHRASDGQRTASGSGDASASAASDSGGAAPGGGTATATNVGGPVGWATSTRHAVRNDHQRQGVHPSRLFPPGQSLVLLLASFVCYPALVFSSVFPPFPLVVNLVVGLCTLILIAYLTSMPEVGVYVFGAWSILVTLAVIGGAVDPVSLWGLLALGATWFPLGLTILTYWVLRW